MFPPIVLLPQCGRRILLLSVLLAMAAEGGLAAGKGSSAHEAGWQATGAADRQAAPGDTPASWLEPGERDAAWIQATARCRELLGKLDEKAPLVREHLSTIQRKTQMLLRTPSFDWKSRTAVEFLENLLEDLLAGRKPGMRYAGQGLGYPYWSETMQRIEAIWVHVPPGYDPAKEYQFFMYYKCGGGIHFKDGRVAGGYRPTVEMANRTDTFHAWSSLSTQVKGRMGAHIELGEATAALVEDFSIDPDRIFLTGWSDGGFTALWLASHYPHLVAGIVPNCANWQYTNVELPALANLPSLIVDGWGDGGFNRSQFVRWQMLRSLGADTSAIWGQHGHSYQPYEDPEEFDDILDWAKSKRRDCHPRKVRYATWNLSWPRAYWVSIERVDQPWLAALIEAEAAGGNRIAVQTANVAAYKLFLSDKLLDPAGSITVETNGRVSYRGSFEEELLVELSSPPAAKYVKSAAMPDGIAAQTVESSYDTEGFLAIPGRTWLAVRPTALAAGEAARLAGWWPEDSKADVELTEADLAAQNLFLYGGPAINRLTARIADELPVRFEPGRFILGERIYDQPTHCIAMLHPNPLNPKKYVILYAFNDAAAFARGGFFEMTGERVWAFRTGDCVVRGIPAVASMWSVAVSDEPFEEEHCILDASWQVPRPEPLGVLTQSFDYMQLLRLQADAIREATGAEIGIVAGHTPRHLRWRERLPAGPVTMHDLATLDALPQYVSTGTMSGEDLAGQRRFQPAAWTVRTDPRQNEGQSGELAMEGLDPAKTYRVALAYRGIPAYRAEPGKMPPLWKFTSAEDFLASPYTGISVSDLALTPLEVSVAVADYIRKQGTVAPSSTGYDLTDYIMNPESNDFGSCDWLHVGIDLDWLGPADKPEAKRYTIGLGMRRADEPESAPPRPDSKRFGDFDLDGPQPASWSFAKLDKHLPLVVTANALYFTVLTDKEYQAFRLGAADAQSGRVGRAARVDLILANEGTSDLQGHLILADSCLRKVNGEVWPGGPKEPDSYYAGYHRRLGKWKEPPSHEDAVLVLFSETAPRPEKLITPGAGYNFGLVGVRLPLDVPAGQTQHLPLLVIAIDRPAEGPALSLAAVLISLKAELAQSIGLVGNRSRP